MKQNETLKLIFDKCFAGLIFVLIPFSFGFPETIFINTYFVNVVLSIFIILLCIRSFIEKETLRISLFDILFLLVICLSAFSSIIKNHPLQSIVYISLLLYWGVFVLAKPFIPRLNIPIYLFYAIIFSNLYIIFRIGMLLLNNHNFTPYLEKHFANIGICAIFLAISSIVSLNRIYFSKRKIDLVLLPLIAINLILIVYLKSRISIFLIVIYFVFLLLKKVGFKSNIYKNIIFTLIAGSLFLFLLTGTKRASSEGRTFILKISTNVIKDNLLTGTGGFNTFPLYYPKYQADYFSSGFGSEQEIMLADNTKNALNEPVQLLAELGIIGFTLVLLLLIRTISLIRKESYLIKHLFFCLLFASCFYYVFHITLFQVILCSLILCVSYKDKIIFQLTVPISVTVGLVILLLCTKSFYFSQSQFIHSLKIEKRISKGYTLVNKHNVLQAYFKDNPVFLTFYAHELFHKKKYAECLETLNLIDQIYIHSELENLKGRLLSQMRKPEDAELSYIRACNICPNRFRYKYDLFKFYLENNQKSLAKNVALEIHHLKEKIPSPASMAIKLEIERFLTSQ